MKIIVIAWHLTPSEGWGTVSRNHVLGLESEGHEVIALVHEQEVTIGTEQRVCLPAPLACMRSPLSWLRVALLLLRTDRTERPDIIHFIAEPYLMALPFTFGRLRAKTTVTACGTWSILPLAYNHSRALLLRAYRMLSGVLAISHYTKERLITEVRQHSPRTAEKLSQKTEVFALSIDTPDALQDPPQNAIKQILFVGEVKPRKGVLELVNACGKLSERTEEPFHCTIIGKLSSENYTTVLRERIAQLGLEDRITLAGHVSEEELDVAYATADLFVMLSKIEGAHFEGYGLVFLEANARGIPVVGPNIAGCTDAISEGQSGFTVDPHNPDNVASTMEKILFENAIDHTSAYTWAKEHSHKRSAQEIGEHYTLLLGS